MDWEGVALLVFVIGAFAVGITVLFGGMRATPVDVPVVTECVQIAEDYVLCDGEHLAKFLPMQP